MAEFEYSGGWNQDIHPEPELTNWETFQSHREIIVNFLKRLSAPFGESLCVLGAGYCDDLDLKQLTRSFDKVTLVDIDSASLDAGVAGQKQQQNAAIEKIGGCDVTGVRELLVGYQTNPSESAFNSIIETAANFQLNLPERYDSIASTCLLSQLHAHATHCVGESHERFVELLTTIRHRHIHNMLERLNPGGVGFLITDFVSSESLPELYTTKDLKQTVAAAIAENNYLHGLNPALVTKVFEHPDLKSQLTGIKLTDPWRWVLPSRIYACFAIIFEKSGKKKS